MRVILVTLCLILFSSSNGFAELKFPDSLCDSISEVECADKKNQFIADEFSKAEAEYKTCSESLVFKTEVNKIVEDIKSQTNQQIENLCRTLAYDYFTYEIFDSVIGTGVDTTSAQFQETAKKKSIEIFEALSLPEQTGIITPCESELRLHQINQIKLMTLQLGC